MANAKANLNKANAADDLAKTQEKIALNTQRADAAAISVLKVAEAMQTRVEATRQSNRRRPPSSRHRATFRPCRRSWTMLSSISINAR